MNNLKIGDAFIYLHHVPNFREQNIYRKVYVERIIYGPDIVLSSDGKWWGISEVVMYRDLLNTNNYNLSIMDTVPRNPKNMLLPIPKDKNARN